MLSDDIGYLRLTQFKQKTDEEARDALKEMIRGACFLGGEDLTVIDIGGQDTNVILVRGGRVADFIMNDKCSAGTGKFLKIILATQRPAGVVSAEIKSNMV